MKNGFLSEFLVVCGTYLTAVDQVTLGILCIVLGVIGGCARFFYKISAFQTRERRISDFFEVSKSLLVKLLQAINDAASTPYQKDKTVH